MVGERSLECSKLKRQQLGCEFGRSIECPGSAVICDVEIRVRGVPARKKD